MKLHPIAQSVVGSTVEIDHPGAAERIDLLLWAQEGRSEGAGLSNHDRSAIKRRWVDEALGAMPLSEPIADLIAVVEKSLKAKGRKVGLWTIEDQIGVRRGLSTETAPIPCEGTTSKSA